MIHLFDMGHLVTHDRDDIRERQESTGRPSKHQLDALAWSVSVMVIDRSLVHDSNSGLRRLG